MRPAAATCRLAKPVTQVLNLRGACSGLLPQPPAFLLQRNLFGAQTLHFPLQDLCFGRCSAAAGCLLPLLRLLQLPLQLLAALRQAGARCLSCLQVCLQIMQLQADGRQSYVSFQAGP